MKVVILAGGQATRLLPLTSNTPKAMVPVLNIPFLEYVIRHLGRHRVTDVVLAQSHLAQTITDYFLDGARFGSQLTYVVETVPLGTAGAVKNAAGYLDETFLVLNGDTFTDLDISAMIDFHRQTRARLTIACTPVEDPSSYGLIETDGRSKITRFLEKPEKSQITTNMVNAGTYVVEPEVLEYIPAGTVFSFERQLFPKLLERGEPLYAYPSPAYWIDIGTPEKYHQLNRDLLSGKSNQYPFSSTQRVTIGERSQIHATARITGPAVIGDSCAIGAGVSLIGPVVIGPGCTILEETTIEDSIIWQDTRLEKQVYIKSSIVASGCHLKSNSIVENSVIGNNVTIDSGYQLKPGSKIGPGAVVKNADNQ
ncbi:MAG: NDP-sugar synthase [Dehalococcoidales bacterium]|nr:NDP-sugar synthase [Dehalococcoidales bacterium]